MGMQLNGILSEILDRPGVDAMQEMELAFPLHE
jgi:hypothetical protein